MDERFFSAINAAKEYGGIDTPQYSFYSDECGNVSIYDKQFSKVYHVDDREFGLKDIFTLKESTVKTAKVNAFWNGLLWGVSGAIVGGPIGALLGLGGGVAFGTLIGGLLGALRPFHYPVVYLDKKEGPSVSVVPAGSKEKAVELAKRKIPMGDEFKAFDPAESDEVVKEMETYAQSLSKVKQNFKFIRSQGSLWIIWV